MRTPWFTLVPVALFLVACGSEEPSGGSSGSGGNAVVIPPLAPASTPEPVPVTTWQTCFVPAAAKADPVFGKLEKGLFTLPTGPNEDCKWKTVAAKPDGSLGKPFSGVLYAATEIDAKAHVFARGDSILAFHGDDGQRMPGDLYGSGKQRAPVVSEPGKHVVVARALGGRSEVFVEFFSTPDEIVFNPLDATRPDLIEGDLEERALGVPVLNVSGRDAVDIRARVEESEYVEPTMVEHAGLPAGALTQLRFQIVPKAKWPAADTEIEVGLRFESPSLEWSYRTSITLKTVAAGGRYVRTFVSTMDGSAQYYGVVPPKDFDPSKSYGLVMSLHGASVEASGLMFGYEPKDWGYIVVPTNRRPFGFDWEEYGRRDGIEVLEDAQKSFGTASDRVYLTGHSMGGHGNWQFGTIFPGRFATIGPSAGWGTYQSYVNMPKPTGAFARSQASSDTFAYLKNLARRGIYAIHGSIDDNVPFKEGENLVNAVKQYTDDVEFHVEVGANHWWDDPNTPGVECIDWAPLFQFMQAHTLDPFETDFDYTTPAPFVNARHSYATILSQADAWADSQLVSAQTGDAVTLTTTNVRALRIDGKALVGRGVKTLVVDGKTQALAAEDILIGPETGKRLGMTGPLNEVFARPFCFVIDDDAPEAYDRYAAYLLGIWQSRGNGRGCALRMKDLTPSVRAAHNLVYLGVPAEKLGATFPFAWSSSAIAVGDTTITEGGLAFLFPEGDRLSAIVTVTAGAEHLLYRFQPFRSAYAPPDYLAWDATGVQTAGFFAPDWSYVPGK